MTTRLSIKAPAYRAVARLVLLVAVSPLVASAASVPVGFVDRTVATGITSPTSMAMLPEGRLLVTQQNGRVRLIKNDVLSTADFYVVADVDFRYERGLLGVLADPDFKANRFVYLYYTARAPAPHQRILRVTASADGVQPDSERVLLDLPDVPPGAQWHMGGAMRFGADGKLYVGVGNHEDSNQPDSSSSTLTNPFGKILRLNPDGSVPRDNPFSNVEGAYTAIWAYGLRNPFTFDVQAATGLMYINDVGDTTWEEVNRGEKGAHYGWPASQGPSTSGTFVGPSHAYPHGAECAVVGAAFYQPAEVQFPSGFVGRFLFGDFCAGWIRVLDPETGTVTPFVTGLKRLVNIAVAPDGSVYYLDRKQHTGEPTEGGATVGKITYTGSRAPRLTRHPEDVVAYLGDAAHFSVAADDGERYQWQRDGRDIPGATSATYTIPATRAADDGARFRVVVSNAFGRTSSADVALTVNTNRAPAGTISTPGPAAAYEPDDEVRFAGEAVDPEDGALPASSYTWQVDVQHDSHAHPFMAAVSGITSGSFATASDHAAGANVWYRLYLTVADSGGRRHTSYRELRPRTPISEMPWMGTPVNGGGPVEKDQSSGGRAADDGGTLTLDGVAYAKGLGVHAPSDVRYALEGACSGAFIADVGVDDEVAGGTVVFEVWVDGVKAFDSGLVRRSDSRRPVNLDVAGARELRLVVTDGGDGSVDDHADWAGARVSGCAILPLPAMPTALGSGSEASVP